jgi:hypothetical protein
VPASLRRHANCPIQPDHLGVEHLVGDDLVHQLGVVGWIGWRAQAAGKGTLAWPSSGTGGGDRLVSEQGEQGAGWELLRMTEQAVTDELLLRMLEEGDTRYRDASHLWVWLRVPGRDDNLLCAVLVLEHVLIVKTVLHRWELMP